MGKRRGKETEERQGDVVGFPRRGRQEKGEKEGEKEEQVKERKEGEEGQSGWPIGRQEGSQGSLRGHWARPRAKDEKEAEKEVKKKAEEGEEHFERVKWDLNLFQHGGSGRGGLTRQIKSTTHCGDRSRSLDGDFGAEHEKLCSAGLGLNMGGRRGCHPPHHEPVREVFSSSQKLGRAAQGGHDAGLSGGPIGPGPSGRSSGCAEPAPQKPRASGEWPSVGHSSKNRNSSTSRGLHGVSCRGADSAPGGAAGLPSEGQPGPVGEGQEQRERQGQRQGQREEQRRHQRKGGKQKELLTEGGEEETIAWEKAPESEESFRETKAGVAKTVVSLGGLAYAGRRSGADAKFHSHQEGGAATPPGLHLCTGAESSSIALEQDRASSGLGRETAEKEVSENGGVVRVESFSAWLNGKLDVYFDRLCKTLPSGRVFPLPTSSVYLSQVFSHFPPDVICMLRVLVVSLNSLNSEGLWNDQEGTPLQVEVLEGLVQDCARFVAWDVSIPAVTWGEFFKSRGVDYKGDEILTAQSMQWENVRGALPSEVGGVRLEDVVELGSRHYVVDFESYLLPTEAQQYTRPPRVLVPPDQWETFCDELP